VPPTHVAQKIAITAIDVKRLIKKYEWEIYFSIRKIVSIFAGMCRGMSVWRKPI